jgi:hypothetical protein
MGWLYESSELVTEQDYIDKLEEIRAYQSLDGKPFDFGTGLIINDGEFRLGSEDTYYEMSIADLESHLGCDDYWVEDGEYNHYYSYYWKPTWKTNKRRIRRHKYYRDQIGKRKIEKLNKIIDQTL